VYAFNQLKGFDHKGVLIQSCCAQAQECQRRRRQLSRWRHSVSIWLFRQSYHL